MTSILNKILSALLLLIVLQHTQGYAQANSGEQNSAGNPGAAQPQHVIIDQINAHISNKETAEEKAKEDREERRKTVEIFLTWAIASAAGAQAIFAFLQWRMYLLQLKTSMPLVALDWENMVHLSPPDQVDSKPNEMTHYFQWGMRNTGQTPAFVTETSVRFVSVPTSQGVSAFNYAPAEAYTGEPLFCESKPIVGGCNRYTRIDDVREFNDIEDRYRSGEETLFAFGYVRFMDRYGKKHKSSFCLKYFAWKSFRHDYDGFGISQDKPNKYT